MALSNFKLTDKGRTLWNKVLSGSTKLLIKEIRIGSGTLTEEQIPTMTALVAERAKFSPSSVAKTSDGTGVCISVMIDNKAAIDSGYTWTESAIYAIDPDEGDIILAAAWGGSEVIPKYGDGYPYSITHNIILGISDTENVTLVTDASSYLTQGNLEVVLQNYMLTADIESRLSDQDTKVSAVQDTQTDQAKKLFEHYFGLANVTTSITRDAEGRISRISQTNSSESVTAQTELTREDGSLVTVTTTVTPSGSSVKYIETVTLTRDSDGISRIAEVYTTATA